MKISSVFVLAMLLALSACGQNGGPKGDGRADSDRRIDLEGKGVVSYKLKRPDIADGGSEETTLAEVRAIRFYESYIVVELKDGAAKVLPSAGLITFDLKK